MDFNVDYLAQETLRLASSAKRDPRFNFDSVENDKTSSKRVQEDLIDHLFNLVDRFEAARSLKVKNHQDGTSYPVGPGLIYKVQHSGQTFIIKGEAVEELASTLKEKNDDNFYFFSTPDLATAEVIADALLSRRFPVDEEGLCNLADPGFSWWFNEGDGFFHIYFKSQGLDRSKKFLQLGPMGDLHLAHKYFKQLTSVNCSSEPFFSNISHDKRSLRLVGQGPSFEAFKNLFRMGDTSFVETDILTCKTMKIYFKELAYIRQFWMQLGQNNSFNS